MEIITILIALAVEQYYKAVEHYRQFDWFASYCDWMQQKSEPMTNMFPTARGPVTVVILLTPIVLISHFILSALDGMGFFFSFIFGVVLLIYSLGPRDLNAQVDKYTEAVSSGDTEGALLHANNFFSGHNNKPEFGGSPFEIAELMKRGILLAFNNRILAVLFWFLILGPIGALLYRLTSLLMERYAGGYFAKQVTDENESDFIFAIQRLYMILGWVPARLCVIIFALAGSFSDTLLCWRCATDFVNDDNDELIIKSGLHALKMDVDVSNAKELDDENDEVTQVLVLVKWSLVIVVTIIALMTITGWIY